MVRGIHQANRLIKAALLLGMMTINACREQSNEAQLLAWHEEAIAANNRLIKANSKTEKEWQLQVQGQIKSKQSLPFDWQTLESLAKTQISTKEPHLHSSAAVSDFRGVPVSALLDRAGIAKGVTDITFVAFDAFRATLKLEDLQRYPSLLALTRDGKPIPRTAGGPLYLVHPTTQFPELRQRYDGVAWVFYVTHIIVGTEPVSLKVGKRTLIAEDLDKLPQVTLTMPVGYRLFWPHGDVQLQGVRLQDALAAAGETLPGQGTVTVKGKAPIDHDPKKPFRLSASTLKACDILLVRRWGDDLEPVPARLGGPLTLAFAPSCPATAAAQQPWMTFVESLEVNP